MIRTSQSIILRELQDWGLHTFSSPVDLSRLDLLCNISKADNDQLHVIASLGALSSLRWVPDNDCNIIYSSRSKRISCKRGVNSGEALLLSGMGGLCLEQDARWLIRHNAERKMEQDITAPQSYLPEIGEYLPPPHYARGGGSTPGSGLLQE